MTLRFDHFITYTSASSVDDHIAEYAGQGFAVSERSARHEPGLRTRFVFFGPDYVEFAWVEDEAAFALGANADDKFFRADSRPYGIGLVSDDVNQVHADLKARGFDVPEVWSKTTRDAQNDAAPKWSFQEIPQHLLPGALCFALTYHSRSTTNAKVVVPRNTVYGIEGVICVTPEPAKRSEQWSKVLGPVRTQGLDLSKAALAIGPHTIEWLTKEHYEEFFGLPWRPPARQFGELAALKLLATDLTKAQKAIEAAGRKVSRVNKESGDILLVEPSKHDGWVFVVRQLPVEVWTQQRSAITYERFSILPES